MITQDQLKAPLKYDVNVMIDADKNSSIIQKYEKWKKRAKEYEKRNKELAKKIDVSQNIITTTNFDIENESSGNDISENKSQSNDSVQKSRIKSLKAELKQISSQYKKDLESLHSQIIKHKNDKEELKSKIRQMETDIQNKEIVIKSMTDEQSGDHHSAQSISNKMDIKRLNVFVFSI